MPRASTATKTAASTKTRGTRSKAAASTEAPAKGTRGTRKAKVAPEPAELTPQEKRRARRAANIAAKKAEEATPEATTPKRGRRAKEATEPTEGQSKRAARQAQIEARKVERSEALNKEATKVTAALKKNDGDVEKTAADLGMSRMKVRKLSAHQSVKSADRITGTDEEVGAEIARLRDEEGLGWMPELWSRTGMTPKRMKALYEQATGRSWKESGKTKEKRRQRETKKAERAASGKAPRGAGRRAQRAANKEALEELHSEDVTKERVAELIQGKSVTITYTVGDDGKEHEDTALVKKVRRFGPAKTGGKAVDFLDGDGKSRVIKVADITAIG